MTVELMQGDVVGRSPGRRPRAARPCIKPHFSIEMVPPGHVYLLSEHASHVLSGRLYCEIVPHLDGRHTVDEISALLSGSVSRDHLDHVVERLRRLGYLTDAADEMPAGVAAFWSELGFDPCDVEAGLRPGRIALSAIGDVDARPLGALLERTGLAVGFSPAVIDADIERTDDLHVVMTDDYLRPELAAINRAALRSGRAWMLVRPVGSVVWLGPVFEPGATGCWQCLAQRLAGNAEIKTSILRQRDITDMAGCLPTARPAYALAIDAALNWTAIEIAKWVVARATEGRASQDGRSPTLRGGILTFDHVTHSVQRHALPHRPQCPACGDASMMARRGFQPIDLMPSPKRYVDDGGHRSMTPDQTLAQYQELLSSVTGVVTELVRISDLNNPLVHTYKASHSMGSVGTLRGLRQLLRHKSSGKGKTDAQSRASGLCEAIERYAFIWQGDEPRRKATLMDLGDAAVHPARCLHFSETQYADRDELNTASIGHDWIPMRFDPDRSIDWTPLWSLTEQRHKLLPTAYCYLWYRLPADHDFCRADSNGNAAGNTIEEAILQGLFEVIERDAVSLWWYNALRRPAVDLDSFNDPYFHGLQQNYRTIGRELWVLDLTADLGIPVMAAVSRRTGEGAERLIVGYGAHLDAAVAITRALTEMSQVGLELDKVPDGSIDPDSARWLIGARLDNKPYLVPDPLAPAKRAADFASRWSGDCRDDVLALVATIRQRGLEVLVLDLTRPDIGLPVVKVVVPGMRFFWQRFAPGRLYDVPVALGWLQEPTPEAALNRTPMPF